MPTFTTISANDFIRNGGERDKFPHTGPVNYGFGARPYTAAFKGRELKTSRGQNRVFASARAAAAAILEESKKTS